jgi:hypothetical protein
MVEMTLQEPVVVGGELLLSRRTALVTESHRRVTSAMMIGR